MNKQPSHTLHLSDEELHPIALADLLAFGVAPQSLSKMLREFCCAKEKDAVRFIHKKAIDYETNNKAETVLYLCCSADAINRLHIYHDVDGISLAGYFALAPALSDYEEEEVAGILIAQLARDDRWGGNGEGNGHPFFDGARMLYDAEKLAISMAKRIYGYPGREPEATTLYLDCKKGMCRYYERHGYDRLFYDKPIRRVKMFKRVAII